MDDSRWLIADNEGVNLVGLDNAYLNLMQMLDDRDALLTYPYIRREKIEIHIDYENDHKNA